jgi:hypothetical protein
MSNPRNNRWFGQLKERQYLCSCQKWNAFVNVGQGLKVLNLRIGSSTVKVTLHPHWLTPLWLLFIIRSLMNVLAVLLIYCIFLNFGMYFIFNTYWRNDEKVCLSNFYFCNTIPLHQSESFFFYEPSWLAGLAGHTSSTV